MNNANTNSSDEWECCSCGAPVEGNTIICPKCGEDVSKIEEEDLESIKNSENVFSKEKTPKDSECHQQSKSKTTKSFFRHIILLIIGAVFIFFGVARFLSPSMRPMWVYSLPFHGPLILSGIGLILIFIGLFDWSYTKYRKDPPIVVGSNKIIRNYLIGILLTFLALAIGSAWVSALLMPLIYMPLIFLIARHPSSILFIPIIIGFFLSFIFASIAGRIIWKNRGQPYFSPVRIFWFLAFIFIIVKSLFMIFITLECFISK